MKKCKDAKMQKLIKTTILNLCQSTHLLQIPGDNIANFGKVLTHVTGGRHIFQMPTQSKVHARTEGD